MRWRERLKGWLGWLFTKPEPVPYAVDESWRQADRDHGDAPRIEVLGSRDAALSASRERIAPALSTLKDECLTQGKEWVDVRKERHALKEALDAGFIGAEQYVDALIESTQQQPKETTMSKFEVFRDAAGGFTVRLRAKNGRKRNVSESYTRHHDAIRAAKGIRDDSRGAVIVDLVNGGALVE